MYTSIGRAIIVPPNALISEVFNKGGKQWGHNTDLQCLHLSALGCIFSLHTGQIPPCSGLSGGTFD
jgi:hypothetical protein